jgi:uncharacterized membrane protein
MKVETDIIDFEIKYVKTFKTDIIVSQSISVVSVSALMMKILHNLHYKMWKHG